MKKFISLMLSLVMFSGMTVSYAADDTPLKAALKDYFDTHLGLPVNLNDIINIPVATDICVWNGVRWKDQPVTMDIADEITQHIKLEADIDMSGVKNVFNACIAIGDEIATANAALQPEWDSCYVKGGFTVNIDYPATSFVINSAALDNNKTMDGFSTVIPEPTPTDVPDHNEIFEETSRGLTTSPYGGYKRLTINIKVKDNNSETPTTVGVATLAENLSDLKLTYEDNQITSAGTYTIRGSVEGYTDIYSSEGQIGHIVYDFSQKDGHENDAQYRDPADDISATIIVSGGSSPDGGNIGSGGVTHKTLTIMDGDNEHSEKKYIVNTGIEIGSLEIPKRDGYVFAGYYYDKEFTKPVEETLKLKEDTVIYIKWTHGVLDDENHIAYIIGYPMEDGREEVRPEHNMTREEIATVFYRLLKEEARDELFATTNTFPDVEDDRWSNKAVSTMANGKYVNGYEDGTFKPGNPITRAEFVTIATRFFAVDDVYAQDTELTDVSGHWAEKYINYATVAGWINGYEDNTFRPDKYISRAEVMKIINHMLNRAVNEEGLVADAKRWIDNSQDKWYYYEVIEATNFHSYNKVQDTGYEAWTEILENKILVDKAEYEDAETADDDSEYDKPLL